MKKYGEIVLYKLTKTTQFFQYHGHSPHPCRSGCNWRSGVTGRSPKVRWRHNPFFANKSRQDGDSDAQMVPNDLPCRAASKDVHIDLLGLTWPEVKFSNWLFKLKKVHVSNQLDEANTMVSFLLGYLPYQKFINEKPSPWKTTAFHLMTSGAKTFDLRSILNGKCYRCMRRTPPCFSF